MSSQSMYLPTPIDEIARLVRRYAKKVLSDAKWSLATLPEFSSTNEGSKYTGIQEDFLLADGA